MSPKNSLKDEKEENHQGYYKVNKVLFVLSERNILSVELEENVEFNIWVEKCRCSHQNIPRHGVNGIILMSMGH